MERCRLCYGRVVNGHCVDCGLDNSKSDKNYRLNTHNPKSVRMHSGDCNTHLNKEAGNPAKKQTANHTTQSAAKAQKSTTAARPVQGTGRIPTGSARARQLKKRQATGTVQHRRGKKWVALLVIAAVYVIPAVIEVAEDHIEEIREVGSRWKDGSLGDVFSGIFGEDGAENQVTADLSEPFADEAGELPQKIQWDTEDPLYYEKELTAGFYTAGYDFPSGTYQMTCTLGNALVEWYAADAESEENGYALLLSDAWKESLDLEEDETYAEYGAHTEALTFEENTMIYVQDDGDVVLAGMKDSQNSIKARQTQTGLPKSVTVSKDGLESGKDFPEGVYDICYQGSGFVAFEINYDEGNTFYMDLGADHSVIQRVPFEQSGITITMDEYDMNEGDLVLKPSW